MCTSLAIKTNDFYFGRNMDIEYSFGEKIVITPRNFSFPFKKTHSLEKHFAIIGMAAVVNQYPLYAEAVNEKGLGMASLDFRGNAFYDSHLEKDQANISPFELIPWILGQCENIDQVEELLKHTHVVAIPFSPQYPLTDLHWHIADSNRSLVLECRKTGMHIYENPAHVLTNNPPFEFQQTNLAQYLNLNTLTPNNCFSEKIGIKPFCKGMGSIGLPGDFSSTSRFVKAAYLRLNSVCGHDEKSSVAQFFHILDSVGVINGSIDLGNGKPYMTTYSCCMNASQGIYYYKSYYNSQISAVYMHHENLDTKQLIIFIPLTTQQLLCMN